MLAYTLRGLGAHRLRSAGMALAVFLGVALVSGTFILTDTINRSFDDIFDQALKGTDVVITPREIVRQDMEEPPPFDAGVLERVQEVPGVEASAGAVNALVRPWTTKTSSSATDSRPTSCSQWCRSRSSP